MDWSVIIAVSAAGASIAAVRRMYRLNRDVYRFEEKVENALDDIISGKGISEGGEDITDSLWGKCGEKLWRVNRIWTKKEETGRREKELMKELISDISHQTKTPIANMKLYLEFLQEEELSGKGREFLGHLEGQTQKLDFLLQSMVKMSRLETGTFALHVERTSLYDTIAQAVNGIWARAEAKGLRLSVEWLRLSPMTKTQPSGTVRGNSVPSGVKVSSLI